MSKKVGALYSGEDTCEFRVWAPDAKHLEVIFKDSRPPFSLEKDSWGYWSGSLENVPPGTQYKIRLNQSDEFPDPASRSQPQGVHSWSEVVATSRHTWGDQSWKGQPLTQMSIYELHVGTFTPEGTFEAVIEKLDHLENLGVNALELMPISQFPGSRNWGYDGVYPFAAQHSYGGVAGLQKLVDACHQRGFAVILDVVYNHLGPEGNYLSQFGPYFTDKYHTPWGSALNFDDRYSDPVRHFFIQNALMWLEEFHIDGLRLDAVHEIIDRGARHFLQELRQEVDELEKRTGRQYFLIAESDLNDSRIIQPYSQGGYGLDAQWVDDFHHSLHTLLTGESAGYYQDYGKVDFLGKSFHQAFVYDGIYSDFRKRKVGNSPAGLDPSKFVICIQNHDQVGNRVLGERLSQLVDFERQKLAAGSLLTAPFVPMLFMGEEFGEDRPFHYFVSHGDPELVRAVQEGRKKEFEYFHQSAGEFCDPQAESTFEDSKINWDFQQAPEKARLLQWYKHLFQLRSRGAFAVFQDASLKTEANEQRLLLELRANKANRQVCAFFNFSEEEFPLTLASGEEIVPVVASAEKRWGGRYTMEEIFKADRITIPPTSMLVFERDAGRKASL